MKFSRSPLALAVVSALAVAPVTAQADLFFSEYVEGSSNNKALEIYNNTGAAVDLSDYSIEIYANGNSAPNNKISLSGALADNAVFVIANSNAGDDLKSLSDATTGAISFNGNDAVVLKKQDVTVDSIGQVGVNPGSAFGSGMTSTKDHTLRRKPTVTTGDTNDSDAFDPANEWLGFAKDSFDNLGKYDANNNGGGGNGGGSISIGECGEDATLISTIQSDGLVSPLNGQQVVVEAIVVGDFQDTGLKGFYVQEEVADQDANPQTSEGIFVYGNTEFDVVEGDRVRVLGTVDEFKQLTEIENVAAIKSCGMGSTNVAQVELPVADKDYLERYEGMAVEFVKPLTVSENYNLGRYGELVLSAGRLINPTNEVAPGADANMMQAANDLNRIILDDAITQQNPDPIRYPSPGLSAFNSVRSGDTVDNLTGILTYFKGYRIQPTAMVNFVASNPRSQNPGITSDQKLIRVASFNVLNYFNGDGQGGGFPTERGAHTDAEFSRQRDKIIAAISAMEADIIGLMEIENDGYGDDSAIADLVNGLNAAAPAGATYDYVKPPLNSLGTDVIAVGMIYRSDRVNPVGSAATIGTGAFADKNRQPLAQTFTNKKRLSHKVTVVVNHFKSKSSRKCPDNGGDANQKDGQACWNATRVAAAKALVAWLETMPTGVDTRDQLIIGDLNAYAQEDPISALKAKGYTDLVASLGKPEDRYSYVFYGQAGRLDHALASESLTDQVKQLTTWHINADEPRVLDYNMEYKSPGQQASLYNADAYRSSDHDPVVMDVDFGGSYGFGMLLLTMAGVSRRYLQKR